MHLINHVSVKTLTTGWMIPSGTNTRPSHDTKVDMCAFFV